MTAVADVRRSIETLKEVVYKLSPIERGPGSAGEAEAAHWLADRLRTAGAAGVAVEDAEFDPGFAPALGIISAVAAGIGAASLRNPRLRPLAAVSGVVLAATIADDVSNGPRVMRRFFTRPKRTQNVVARVGDEDAPRTLLVLAHHDAAPTGAIFDQTLQHAVADRFPGLIAKSDTAPPMWWPVIAGPLLVGLGSAFGRRGIVKTGTGLSATTAAAMADIARDRIVPGANDNLSACAVLVAVAERLVEEPVDGLRVVLASCGAEEVCQGGIYDFFENHRDELPRASTSVLNLDTVGSPFLAMLEGEGTVLMEDYPDPSFRELVATAADKAGVRMKRGMRATSSTDSVLFARGGYRVTTLVSVDHAKSLSNYHMMSDTAENLDYNTVADALEVTLQVARDLTQ